ncbi:MAG TPA: response regulator, partial [Thermodesulfobacteriota bacterium]|nr:response regulator [Thermodesulfobacteriota bacterium]
MKVLIVDDNEELACAMSYVVERETKYHARTAPDGCRGYLTYLEFKPDIVITDIRNTSAGLILDEKMEGRLFIRDEQNRLVAELQKL